MACSVACKTLEAISDSIPVSKDSTESLVQTAMTTLGSKMWVNKEEKKINEYTSENMSEPLHEI